MQKQRDVLCGKGCYLAVKAVKQSQGDGGYGREAGAKVVHALQYRWNAVGRDRLGVGLHVRVERSQGEVDLQRTTGRLGRGSVNPLSSVQLIQCARIAVWYGALQ